MLDKLISLISGRPAPTIVAPKASPPTSADHRLGRSSPPPTISLSAIERFNLSCNEAAVRAEPIGKASLAIDAAAAAAAFLRWARNNDLCREWPVDAIWFLASEDFAPAAGLALPPRRVFLGALQRQNGVTVVYDRRVYGRTGRVLAKTTFYTLPTTTQLNEWTGAGRLAA